MSKAPPSREVAKDGLVRIPKTVFESLPLSLSSSSSDGAKKTMVVRLDGTVEEVGHTSCAHTITLSNFLSNFLLCFSLCFLRFSIVVAGDDWLATQQPKLLPQTSLAWRQDCDQRQVGGTVEIL
mmetsp:Transcript_1951/g.4370  ORF Transcript_1951/g.4370 Transcript_1951/m.4370 type:complete len:124 (-) Transcript_1951:934-1305(-)